MFNNTLSKVGFAFPTGIQVECGLMWEYPTFSRTHMGFFPAMVTVTEYRKASKNILPQGIYPVVSELK